MVLVCFVNFAQASTDSPEKQKFPFAVGEQLIYDISWLGIVAGEGELKVRRGSRYYGKEVYRLSIASKTIGWVRDWFIVDDLTTSLLDTNLLLSHRSDIKLSEGNYKKKKLMLFDQKRRKVWYRINNNKLKEFDITPDSLDPLSSLFVLRTMRDEIRIGQRVILPLFDSAKNYEMVVDVIKRERLKLKEGMVDTIMVKPQLKTEGVFMRKGDLWIWFTDDDNMTPVMIRSALLFGSFDVELKSHKGVDINFIPYPGKNNK